MFLFIATRRRTGCLVYNTRTPWIPGAPTRPAPSPLPPRPNPPPFSRAPLDRLSLWSFDLFQSTVLSYKFSAWNTALFVPPKGLHTLPWIRPITSLHRGLLFGTLDHFIMYRSKPWFKLDSHVEILLYYTLGFLTDVKQLIKKRYRLECCFQK